MKNIENKKIAIVGGGPGGLTLARLLQLGGADVKVYERDVNKDVRVQGATLDLHDDSGLKALAKAGLMEAFKANYRPGADRTRIVDKHAQIVLDENVDAADEFSAYSRPEIDRGPLRKILLESLQPGTVVWNSHILSLTPVGDSSSAAASLATGSLSAAGASSSVGASSTTGSLSAAGASSSVGASSATGSSSIVGDSSMEGTPSLAGSSSSTGNWSSVGASSSVTSSSAVGDSSSAAASSATGSLSAAGASSSVGASSTTGFSWTLIFQNGESATADIVIGADGANSKIRPLLTPIRPWFVGMTAVEGAVYEAEKTAPRIYDLLQGGKIFAFGDEKSLIVSSKGDGSMSFYIGFKTEEFWFRTCGIDFTDKAQVLDWFIREFSGWDPVWRELFENASTPFIPRPQYCMPLDQSWTAQPNLTLLGDAAHLMPPYAGEGVNMAMLDALELSQFLVSDEFPDLSAAIAAYEKQMSLRFAEVGQMTLEQTVSLHSPDAIANMVAMFGPHG